MKSKYFLIKISGIVFLIMIVVVYFLVYFLPTIKGISRYKRELKDMNLKSADFVKMESSFSYSDNRERQLLKESQDELAARIPEINNREEFITLFTRVSNYIKNVAKKDGIYNLVITSDSKELKVTAGSLSTDKRSLNELLSFSSQRLNLLKKQTEMEARNSDWNQQQPTATTNGGLPTLVEGVKYQTIWLSFTGELSSSTQFINHIPWSAYYLNLNKIIIATGDLMPYYIVSLRIYYIDRSPGQQEGNLQ